MCGIVGYVGRRPVQDLLLAGLSRLEYRGYDSAGISMIAGDAHRVRARRGQPRAPARRRRRARRAGRRRRHGRGARRTTGIGHTRWATHGRVNEENAHPHFDTAGRVHVVVNGIVENYLALKERLLRHGRASSRARPTPRSSPTSSPTTCAAGSLTDAVRAAYDDLEGHYAFVAMTLDEPDVLVGARKECPLIVGRGEGETFLASRDPRLPGPHPPRAVHRERRDRRRHAPTASTFMTARRHRARPRDRRDRLGRGDRREGRLRDLHAQGDPRAGRRDRRDDRRPHASATTASTSTRSARSTRRSCATSSA